MHVASKELVNSSYVHWTMYSSLRVQHFRVNACSSALLLMTLQVTVMLVGEAGNYMQHWSCDQCEVGVATGRS